jgi:hypothetical protein
MTDAEMSLFESGTGNGQRMHSSSIEPAANSPGREFLTFLLLFDPSRLTSLGVLLAEREFLTFSLLIGGSWLTSLYVLFPGCKFLTFSLLICPTLGVFFAAREFLIFPSSLAPHGSLPLVHSLQIVSF